MSPPTEEEIKALLLQILTAGFNRSLGTLETNGIVDTRKLREHYRGIGSPHYDLVTREMELTASYGVRAIRHLFGIDDNYQDHQPNHID